VNGDEDRGMNRIGSDKFYMAVFALFIGALAVGCVVFVVGLRESSYVINDGIGYSLRYFNKPRYDSQLQGLIFTLAFLVAGVLVLMLIILPNSNQQSARAMQGPPQPRQRGARPAAAAPAAAQAAPVAAAAVAPRMDTPAEAPAQRVDLAPAAPVIEDAPAPEPAEQRSVEEEVLSTAPTDDLPSLEQNNSRFDDAGEDDVVYGTGRVTDDAIWEFVQSYPDSAVKFLYRKTLDNKPLTPADEDIYRKWEGRGMGRGKVRQIVLDIMQWKSLPDDFPHNIWRELRDQIFEMRVR
jgi:hypothetical protein